MKYIDDGFSFSELKRIIRKVFIFLVLIGFAVSCNFILFLSFAPMNEDAIRDAAPITFVNVLFLTVLFTLIDEVRHFLMVTRPIKQIREGMNKIVEGDFHVRIPYVIGENSVNDFDAIIKGVNEMARELSGVETLRTDFISNVSHELKTPLAVIQNYGTMLQSPYISDEERKEYAVAITEQTRKLSNMITNILKLNRLENQQIYPEKKVYNISEQLCECLLMFEHAWEKKNIEIETEIEDDLMVFQDKELLSLVWNNLFSNAVKFTEDNGKISLCVKRDKDSIAVSISDSGCGISPEVGAHIFEKFYQGDTSHATQGNGLGLALVKRVIDIVGGDISVQSVLGEGTTFTVYLREHK